MKKAVKVALVGSGLSNGWNLVESFFHSRNFQTQVFDDGVLLTSDFWVAVMIGCQKILTPAQFNAPKNGTLLFHSSDLPLGRGWAPLFHCIKNKEDLVVSFLKVAEKVDAGDILAKARYRTTGNEIESEIRSLDDQLVLYLLENCFSEIYPNFPNGLKQNENEATYYSRRRPEHSQIDSSQSIQDQFDFIRALPQNAPAFFNMRGRKYFLRLEVAERINFDPTKLKIEKFYD